MYCAHGGRIFGEESEYDEALFGFMGDRTSDKTPLAHQVECKTDFVETRIRERSRLKPPLACTFSSSETNANKFYAVQDSDSTSDIAASIIERHIGWGVS